MRTRALHARACDDGTERWRRGARCACGEGRGRTDRVRPDGGGVVVLLVHRHEHALLGQAKHLGGELPRPLAGVLLEVVTKGEVAEHLEKGVVARGDAHVLDVVRAHAFLRRRRARHAARLRAKEDGLELQHACIRRVCGPSETWLGLPLPQAARNLAVNAESWLRGACAGRRGRRGAPAGGGPGGAPAMVSRTVGSSGTSEDEGRRLWPRSSKKERKRARMSCPDSLGGAAAAAARQRDRQRSVWQTGRVWVTEDRHDTGEGAKRSGPRLHGHQFAEPFATALPARPRACSAVQCTADATGSTRSLQVPHRFQKRWTCGVLRWLELTAVGGLGSLAAAGTAGRIAHDVLWAAQQAQRTCSAEPRAFWRELQAARRRWAGEDRRAV